MGGEWRCTCGRDRERFQQQVHSGEYKELLQALRRDYPFFRRFVTWMDVIAFMWGGTSRDPRKDQILRPILEAHANDSDPRWHLIILVMFLPGLENLHAQKRRWDPDPEELWSNIICTALDVFSRIDLKRRPDRLVQKIYNDTFHRLFDRYIGTWDYLDHETPVDWEELVGLADREEAKAYAGKFDCVNFINFGFQEEKEYEIRRLRAHLEAGRITETDFLLLVATNVYGNSVAEYVRKTGASYQAAKKRRQRAEAVISAFSGKNR